MLLMNYRRWLASSGKDFKRRLVEVSGVFVACLLCQTSVFAQFDGVNSPGVSASLIRLFGTNNAFTALAEVQVLDKNNKERINMPMNFSLLENKIRLEVDMSKMRNREQTDALARMKPLGLDNVVSIIRPDQRVSCIVFPKLKAFTKLEMPHTEADAFTEKAKIECSFLKKEKMQGYACAKNRVTITAEDGSKHEAAVWSAGELRGFPVCVATQESEGTVVIRFSQIQFIRAETNRFEPPAGFVNYSDVQQLVLGPGMKYMQDNGMTIKAGKTAKPAAQKTQKIPPKK